MPDLGVIIDSNGRPLHGAGAFAVSERMHPGGQIHAAHRDCQK
jgi:hypothetical protein